MIKTAGVLVGAYMTRAQGQPRTHLVEVMEPPVDGTWPVTAVLCKRASPSNITDDSTQWTDDRPSCPICGAKWDKEHRVLQRFDPARGWVKRTR